MQILQTCASSCRQESCLSGVLPEGAALLPGWKSAAGTLPATPSLPHHPLAPTVPGQADNSLATVRVVLSVLLLAAVPGRHPLAYLRASEPPPSCRWFLDDRDQSTALAPKHAEPPDACPGPIATKLGCSGY